MKTLLDSIFGFLFRQYGLWAEMRSFVSGIWVWILDHQVFVFLATILLCVFWLLLMRLRRRFFNIRKLWVFILFFLTKRQMFIPLIYVLAKRQPGFESPYLEELLAIREHCREKSVRQSPHQRLQLEKKVSQVLYEYFSHLESVQKIQMQSKFGQVMGDLEFIDAKLVELQRLYNLEALRWNRLMNIVGLGFVLRLFRMRKFDLFSDQ